MVMTRQQEEAFKRTFKEQKSEATASLLYEQEKLQNGAATAKAFLFSFFNSFCT
jgi:hypothetical protein